MRSNINYELRISNYELSNYKRKLLIILLQSLIYVIPAKEGIQIWLATRNMDSRFRGNNEWVSFTAEALCGYDGGGG